MQLNIEIQSTSLSLYDFCVDFVIFYQLFPDMWLYM